MTERANLTDTLQHLARLHTGEPFALSLCDTCDGEYILPCETAQIAQELLGLVSVITQTAQALQAHHFIDGRTAGFCTCDLPWPCPEAQLVQTILDACRPAPKEGS